jgi:hypothetical protein
MWVTSPTPRSIFVRYTAHLMKTSLPPPTPEEQARINMMRPMGCCACLAAGIRNVKELELHHLLDGGRRISHTHTMFLCRGHHQGQWTPRQLISLDPRYRVSIANGRKSFAKAFSSEREMWEQLQARLGLPCYWPGTKMLPRRV